LSRERSASERVVITGLGVITALGCDLEIFWKRLLAGESGIRPISLFDPTGLPCRIAGEVQDFDPLEYLSAKESRRISRAAQLAIAAAHKAVENANLEYPVRSPERVGVYIGTAAGGLDRAVDGVRTLETRGADRVNPFTVPSSIPNMPAFHITQIFGAQGPNATITTACAAGTQAIGEAAEIIRAGRADQIITCGVEALVQNFTLAGFAAMRALPLSYNDDPQSASRPFDAKREGFVFSEGAASVILERLDIAQARGARIYGEVSGYASSSDGYHMAALDPSALGAMRTMRWAMADAAIEAEEIDYINTHGTSTPANDRVETKAIKQLIGDHAYSIPVNSTKSMLGHAMGASGAIETVVCALSLRDQIVHPTINYQFPDPDCDLDYVTEGSRQVKLDTVLSNSFGLGAQNACLVLNKLDG
jgi:3-oxoacyl-[acyl-carrier-protein] synthase II